MTLLDIYIGLTLLSIAMFLHAQKDQRTVTVGDILLGLLLCFIPVLSPLIIYEWLEVYFAPEISFILNYKLKG